MEDLIPVLAASATFVALGMLGMWLLSLALRDASIVDIAWGLGFVGIAWISLFVTPEPSSRGWIVAACTTIWGLRLALYLLWRNRGGGEDPRYARMRAHYGDRFAWQSLYRVYGLQGGVMFIVSLPVQVAIAASTPTELSWLDGLGISLFSIGLLFEVVGDWQLSHWKADLQNVGQVMDRGLWAWTRHPNYFGDCLVWWGLFVLALSTRWGLASVTGPLVMTLFLVRISGAALLERGLQRSKPGYADYIQRTSGFVPRPPRRRPESA
ncbi:MAG: DUF1295 domain-containing protein [Deltaproteobacteria bacterium]|nr:DUF1295 domain-containing protein [Deltaproteobacteria bacterium]MBW2698285.1 DUF1295 domain-containing protein [Deltaproteobacteria bacterium]